MQHNRMPIVISYSDFAHFKRCRKSFDYSFVQGLDPIGGTSEAMQTGTDIHKLLECAVTHAPVPPMEDQQQKFDVANAYLEHRPLPEHIISAERSLYTLVLPETAISAAVYIRTTLDLVYKRGNTIVGRDYKTFQTAPSFDVDLDYQGRIYTVMLSQHHTDGGYVEFEWEYIRQVVGRELSDGKGKPKVWVEWPVQERYLTITMVMSDTEKMTTWTELVQTAKDLVRAIEEQRLYRMDLKSGPHSCDNCHFKALCKTEYSHGALSAIDLRLLSTPKDEGARMNYNSMIADPRVHYLVNQQGMPAHKAIQAIYAKGPHADNL